MINLLHQVLENTADQAPGDTAVVAEGRELTYQQLENRANRLARLLLGVGVRPGDRVGIYLAKSIESVVAVYGVLKAGAAYVPLASDVPATRLAYIIRNAGIGVLLTDRERATTWPQLLEPESTVEHLVCLNSPCPDVTEGLGVRVTEQEAVAREKSMRPQVNVYSDDLAYVLYTSGSTGLPKGVMLTHRNALSFVEWAAAEFALTRVDRLSNHAPLHFDLAVFDLFAAAFVGAAVVLVPPSKAAFPMELATFIRTQRISVWYSVPSLLNLLVSRGELDIGGLPELRLVLFAGEVFPVRQLREVIRLVPDAEFVNLYGPTETNVCTFYRVPRPLPEECDALPIGIPINGVDVFVRTDDGRPADVDEVGELWVRGPTVMRGYLGDSEQTVRALCAPAPGERPAYRTGDLATRDATGLWHFVGRRDNQIKSRGYRIELGEIERALNAHPSIVECAVVPVPDAVFGNGIKAVVVLRDAVSAGQLTAYCRTVLPSFMVPWTFDVIDVLPRTSTGKVDYQVLKVSGDGSDRVRSR